MAKNKKLVKKYGKIGCEIALVFSARRNRKNAFECSLSRESALSIAFRNENQCNFTANFTVFLL